ncbi:hypothetical protein [Jiulongibacter sediminis]|uniref:hypothetical protein n=1 Tax=Jiulongibacter sediminis TaxID=1605367 RepID=UPI0026EEF4BD|nr:hypothetical protein [Jiulongibacter sediminis]
MKKSLFTLTVFALLSSCSSGENSNETLEEKIEEMIPKSDQEPCDFLSKEEVIETFDIEDGIEITQNSSYGVCSFSWEVASEKASEEESINSILEAARSGNISSAVSQISKGSYSVGLNFSTLNSKSKEEARQGYERIIQRLTEGIKVSKETVKDKMEEMGLDGDAADKYLTDENLTYKNDQWEEVDGIGEAATWSSKTSQLTVLSGIDVFFLTVKAGDKEKSLEMARKLAIKVIDNL